MRTVEQRLAFLEGIILDLAEALEKAARNVNNFDQLRCALSDICQVAVDVRRDKMYRESTFDDEV